ncbi:Retrovirus-related Pol polyprotein from transposon 17.6 [Vitis vinifera]|uniref:Retrovirus-related Pol polyprotein from transposon 17.6 n=1 Tax=Vitis vinifera TaxID=29760 RepID=A0A438EW36_VITVI|nr:Retrovirus-related Pol polyprotein from transposon 17.6 [Vitis vinifera]
MDSIVGHGMLSFLNVFFEYHQIPMAPTYEEKIAFIMSHGLYCYKVMPFKLKNAGATYQRLMTKIFKPLISHTVEVYIDDIVVKSKFLGFMVTHRGIEVSLDQVKAVMETSAPKSKIRAVTPHRQTHCLGTLHSPIHRQTETLLPCVEGSRCNRIDGELPVRVRRNQALPHTTAYSKQPLA